MTGIEYQKQAMRTCAIPESEPNARLYHSVFGLNSEAGEVAGIFQKFYQGHPLEIEHLKKELGDCMWMIAECCEACGFSLDDVMETNINKLKARYPDGFEVEHSIHRKAGDI